MFLQDNDPHHMHPDPNFVYYFLILAMILMAIVFFVGVKVMNFLDNRYERKKSNDEQPPVSENDSPESDKK
jgi:large-conductance mechanosensitive channel